MHRRFAIAAHSAAVAVLAVVLLGGCAPKMVRVETGTRTVCTYGEVLTDTVKAIEVPADQATKYSIVTKTVTCDLHRRLEGLYAQAQDAIAAGDLDKARSLLEQIVASDSAFRKAQEQLDLIKAGKTPAKDTETSTPTTGGTTGGSTGGTGSGDGAQAEPIGPIANLKGWVPDVLAGYTATPILADVYVLTREYRPTTGTPTSSLVIVVEQFANAAAVKTAITYTIARDYPEDASTETVNGRSVHFSTDGRRYAIAAWAEGGVMVAVQGSSASGAPLPLKAHVLGIVATLAK